jgi:putative glutamine amidotransferase
MEPLRSRAAALMAHAGGLLLTGGGDVILSDEDGLDPVREMDRDRDFWEAALYLEAEAAGKPVFGICRGLQLINRLLGGTLWGDVPSERPTSLVHQQRAPRTETSHDVLLAEGSLIRSICGEERLRVNSGHHQAAKDVAEGLVATGWSPDGLIEALERPGGAFTVAVQWHPESLAPRDDASRRLFAAFVEAARGGRP